MEEKEVKNTEVEQETNIEEENQKNGLEIEKEKLELEKQRLDVEKERIELDAYDERLRKRKKFRRILGNFIFWVIILGLFAVWVTDFMRVRDDKKPMFCIKKIEHKYDDGTTEECVGLGYKVYNYNRKSINLKSQFAPFFVSMEK